MFIWTFVFTDAETRTFRLPVPGDLIASKADLDNLIAKYPGAASWLGDTFAFATVSIDQSQMV